jgi:imidazole glycerol-phosphate synthase subunit HisH
VIAVIDYGGGNLGSLVSSLTRRKAEFIVTGDPSAARQSSAAILPGDGAFAATMRALTERGLDVAVRDLIERKRPFLGICVGMQVLFERSDEYEDCAGFGYIPGAVTRFKHAPRVPHMGWNDLEVVGSHPFIDGVVSGEYAYFLHSYRAPVNAATLAAATYGERFASVVGVGNIMGTQFHPEKSQATGAKFLDNFVRTACG